MELHGFVSAGDRLCAIKLPDLQAMKVSDPDLKVVVKGADEADYQNMVAVLDVLQQLDITKVGLATE
jgi:biopolymer transport protein ExbD